MARPVNERDPLLEHERIERLLHASSLAIVGASDTAGMGRNLIGALEGVGFRGRVYPVNPKYAEVAGHRCYQSIEDLPPGIEAAAIAVGTERVLPAIRACAERGIRSFVVIAGGFGEGTGSGRDLLEDLRDAAERLDLTICGPNCIGFANLRDRTALWAGSTIGSMRSGLISLVAQSGSPLIALGTDIRSLGCRHLVNTGNEADIDVAGVIDYFARDPETGVIACYLEQVRRPAVFTAALRRAHRAGKPVIAIKGGKSRAGRDAAAAHTASLAGAAEVYNAVFRSAGVVSAKAFDEWLNAIALLSTYPNARKNRVTVVTGSGGCMVMAADTAEAAGVPLAALDGATRKRLKSILPSFVDIRNPLDLSYVGLNSGEIVADTLEALVSNRETDILCIYLPIPNTGMAEAAAELTRHTEVPVIVSLANAAQPVGPEFVETLRRGNVPLLFGTTATFEALASIGRPSPRRARSHTVRQLARTSSLALIERFSNGRGLGESEAKALLTLYGVTTPRGEVCGSAAAAARAATAIGFPVAFKVVANGIAHKAEVGGVALGIESASDARAAYRRLVTEVTRQRPDVEIEGVLVEEQVPHGAEVFVGCRRDAEFGPVLVVGSGGGNVEDVRDVALRLLPADEKTVAEMLSETSLAGYAAHPSLVGVITGIAAIGWEHRDRVETLEVNPVIVNANGVVAVDALIVLDGPTQTRSSLPPTTEESHA